MAKTAAQKQREYRERKKLKDPEYLNKEKERVMAYYKSAAELPPQKLNARNSEAKFRNRAARLKKKLAKRTPPPADDQPPQQLIVRLPAVANAAQRTKTKAKGIAKTRKRALARAHKKIRSLANEVDILKKNLSAKKKQLLRVQRKKTKAKDNTPRKQVDAQLKSMQGVTPKQKADIRKNLLLGNVLLEEIKATKDNTSRKTRHRLHSTIAGKITKKYRLLSTLSERTGLARNSLTNVKTKSFQLRRERRSRVAAALQDSVLAFLSREDNSRTQPGKADAKKTEEGVKTQTLVLTDYLHNLHLKYLAENSEVKMSLATFCRLRPKHILLASFISRNACQCTRHQNMALKISALRKSGCQLNQNPDKIEEQIENIDEILAAAPEPVIFKTWKRVTIKEGDKEFQKMRIVDETVSKEQFITAFKKEVESFIDHVKRVQEQYKQLRSLKQNLPSTDVIVQMDFAENYSCRSLDEIQTAYWNLTAVTLHPMVVYYKNAEDQLEHKSVVAVSDELSHSAGTVCAFIEELIPQIQKLKPEVKRIHYWTDSPTSQYRNRYIFQVVASHEETYNITAQWNYFEAGHGKGPCDGLGGTVKRMADEAIRQGKSIIQDARDFYRWSIQSSMKGVEFVYVDKDECETKRQEIQAKQIKPVKESLKIHAVVGVSPTDLLTRKTSCYCASCLKGEFCDGWTAAKLQPKTIPERIQEAPEVPEIEETREEIEETRDEMKEYEVGKYVACMYQAVWYIGIIEEIDTEEKEVHVRFMEHTRKLLRWPSREDKLWVNISDVICFVKEPVPSGKSKRNYSLDTEDLATVTSLFHK